MSNRQRQARTSRGPKWLHCPDCSSEVRQAWHGDVLAVTVLHDETCPWWQRADGEETAADEATLRAAALGDEEKSS